MNAEQHAEALNIDADGIVRYAKKDVRRFYFSGGLNIVADLSMQKHDALEQMKQSEWEEGPGGLRFKSRGPSRFAYNGMKLPDVSILHY